MMHFSLSRPYPSSGDDSPVAAEPGKCSTRERKLGREAAVGGGCSPPARAGHETLLVPFSLSMVF